MVEGNRRMEDNVRGPKKMQRNNKSNKDMQETITANGFYTPASVAINTYPTVQLHQDTNYNRKGLERIHEIISDKIVEG